MVTIGALISCHEPRVNNGMLERALKSVMAQERPVDAIAVAVDRNGDGAAITKQRALGMLSTDYTAVLDSDDEWLPHHIRIHEEAIQKTGADVVYSWFQTEPPGGDPFPSSFFTDPWDPKNPRHTTTVICARRDMMLKFGYTSAPDGIYEDDDWKMVLGLIEQDASFYHIPDRSWIWHQGHPRTSGRKWK